MSSEYFTQEVIDGMNKRETWDALELFAFGKIVSRREKDEEKDVQANAKQTIQGNGEMRTSEIQGREL